MEKIKSSGGKNQPATAAVAAKTPPAMSPLPPLFRKVDWLAFLITTMAVFIGYYLTLAPDLGLEDSGELAVGSYYAGIPHPPGYPVWTIYSWFWTLIPFGNIAWRVALSSAFAGAVGSGLLAMIVSRGSSMIMEGIEDFKTINRRHESLICIVSGLVAGALIGFNGYMWSQAVIVEVYPLSVVSLMGVMICLMRWVYTPNKHRYLFWAFFLHGICFNNHQSLLPVAIGMEVLILFAEPKLGRDLFFWNTVVYLAGCVIQPSVLWGNVPVRVIFNVIGLLSAAAWLWLFFTTKTKAIELGRDAAMLGVFGSIAGCFLGITGFKPEFSDKVGLFVVLGIFLAVVFGWLIRRTWKFSREWLITLGCGGAWLIGAAFYLYMPVAGMSNPPMQWGYPRTVEGFIHALTRGQYEKIHPTSGTGSNIVETTWNFTQTYSHQMWIYLQGLNDEFNLINLLIILVVFLFFRKMQKRERVWVLGVLAIFICLGPFLLLLINPPPDRQSRELVRVFFTASHTMLAMGVGYGFTLICSTMSVRFEQFRTLFIWGGIAAIDLALFMLAENGQSVLGNIELVDLAANYAMIKLFCWFLAALCIGITWQKGLTKERLISIGIPGIFVLCSIGLTVSTILGNKLDFSGFGNFFHAISISFAPHQYGVPVHAGLILLAIALIYLGSVLYSRVRGPVVITLALFAISPLYSVLTHWSDNEQRNHFFGFWFGHDMFTPPFVAPDGRLSYDPKLREQALKGPNADLVYPEMARDAILFGGTDPGRFNPTYMIFAESFIPANCKPRDPNFDRRDVYIITQNALADGTYLEYIRAHYNRSAQKRRGMDTPFFQQLLRPPEERAPEGKAEWKTNLLARAVIPLDQLFTGIGEKVEKKRRAGSSFFRASDFLDLNGFAKKLQSQETPVSGQLFKELSPETQALLSGKDETKLREKLADDLNRVIEKGLYDDKPLADLVEQRWKATLNLEASEGEMQRAAQNGPEAVRRVQMRHTEAIQAIDRTTKELASRAEGIQASLTTNGIPLTPHLREFILEAPQSFTRIRLNRQLIEAAFAKEIAVSPGGVYPDTEALMPSPADSQRCFSEYITDAQRRVAHDQQFPNEPRQIRQGEDVKIVNDRVQVSGQIAVMAINGLLTKVIFDQNPNNEFYVEESFPLEWMYEYLTPFGVIMKINRQKLPELSDEIVKRDHEFWSKYSERLIGNWLTYDTTVKQITEFVEKVYLKRDFNGFKGDPAFVRDDNGQKAFSKLRSSIAGVYDWRAFRDPNSRNPIVQQRMLKEADFAYRQAFAFCPYSPEAVFRYVNLLINQGRFEDALLVAETCKKLDPYNGQVIGLVGNLQDYKAKSGDMVKVRTEILQMENEYRANPTNFQKAFDLVQKYLQVQQPDRALLIMDQVLNDPNVNVGALYTLANGFAQMNKLEKVEASLEKLVKLAPQDPIGWYNLAALKAAIGKNSEAMEPLRQALTLNVKQLETNPQAKNLRDEVMKDPHFSQLRTTPEFQTLMAPK